MLKPIERCAPARWRSRAFGLELDSDLEIPGLPAEDRLRPGGATRLELVPRASLEQDWPREAPVRLIEESDRGQTAARTIDYHDRAGYRLYASGYGLALIDPDGRRVR